MPFIIGCNYYHRPIEIIFCEIEHNSNKQLFNQNYISDCIVQPHNTIFTAADILYITPGKFITLTTQQIKSLDHGAFLRLLYDKQTTEQDNVSLLDKRIKICNILPPLQSSDLVYTPSQWLINKCIDSKDQLSAKLYLLSCLYILLDIPYIPCITDLEQFISQNIFPIYTKNIQSQSSIYVSDQSQQYKSTTSLSDHTHPPKQAQPQSNKSAPTLQTKADHTSPTTTSKPIINDQQYKMDHEVPLICSAMMPKPKPPANNDDPSGPPDNNNVTPPPSGSNIPSEDVSHSNSDKDDNNTLHKTDDLRYDDDMRYLSILSVCLGILSVGSDQQVVDTQNKTAAVDNIDQQNTNSLVDANMQSGNILMKSDDIERSNHLNNLDYKRDNAHTMKLEDCVSIYSSRGNVLYHIPFNLDYTAIYKRFTSGDTNETIYLDCDLNLVTPPDTKSYFDSEYNIIPGKKIEHYHGWSIDNNSITFHDGNNLLMIIFLPITKFQEECAPYVTLMTQDNANTSIINNSLHDFLRYFASNYPHQSSSSQSTTVSNYTSQELKPMIKPVDACASSSTDLHPIQNLQ